jgi:DNA-binding response OmpR family regulator
MLRALLSDLLRTEGYRVSEAEDGEALFGHLLRSFAAEAQGAVGVDLVVSDLWMPFASGLDVLRRLRAVERRIPFVIVSAEGDPSLGAHVAALDGCLLAKPFTAGDLHFAISRALDRPAATARRG